jgi:pimeloyl-ACP methyl ester carboxylesterase
MSFAPAPRSHHFHSQNLRLHYLEWGDPDAPVLIAQHGGFDHAHAMDWLAGELARDWRVIAPDLRGHGDSAWSPDADYTMAAYLLDFAHLVEATGAERVTILAHSLGAMVTTRFAGLYPEKVARFVNIEGLSVVRRAARMGETYPQRLRNWISLHRAAPHRSPRHYADETAARERMREKNPTLPETMLRHLTHHALRPNADGTLSWKFDPRLNIWPVLDFPEAEIEALWQAVECPILFLHGENSFMPNPQTDGRIRHFRDARIVEYAHAGHWLHHDRLDDVLGDIKRFLLSAP